MNKSNNRLFHWCRSYLIAGGAVGIFWIMSMMFFSIKDSIYLGPLIKNIDEYTGLNLAVMSDYSSRKPYIKGKIIIIDNQKNKIDHIYYDLPENLRATKPENVGTIVLLEWGEDKIGFYASPRSEAIVITCQVTVIDKSIPAIVSKVNFEGPPPPAILKSGESATGAMPTQEIVNYLQGLPRK
jgi:hypothetical protein